MIFSSVFFLFIFLPIVLILYYAVPRKVKNLLLLLCSLIFYAWGEPVYVFLMIFSILFNYLSGIQLDYYGQSDKKAALHTKKMILIFTVIVNLAILGFFKYWGFFLGNINALFHTHIAYKELALPIGISFYTFQTLSYIIDVYRGNVTVQRNLIDFGAYITMFPQLIAGPIVRYSDIAQQLEHRKLSWNQFGDGCIWFIRGLGKKVLLANNIGAIHDSIIGLGLSSTPVISAWIGALCYTMQIYYDFSGYSDMAVGLGKMLGFQFMQNFDYPYIADSITDFWRRWHISLSTWFREYVYIPLGGNRVKPLRHAMNIMIVWLLTGFWHGAAWNFILWGIYYGILLLLEKYFFGRILDTLPEIARRIIVFLVVMIGWVFFSSDSIGSAWQYLGRMIGIGSGGFFTGTSWFYLKESILLLIICFFCATPVPRKYFMRITKKPGTAARVTEIAVYAVLFLLCIAYLVSATYNPFLYFRF